MDNAYYALRFDSDIIFKFCNKIYFSLNGNELPYAYLEDYSNWLRCSENICDHDDVSDCRRDYRFDGKIDRNKTPLCEKYWHWFNLSYYSYYEYKFKEYRKDFIEEMFCYLFTDQNNEICTDIIYYFDDGILDGINEFIFSSRKVIKLTELFHSYYNKDFDKFEELLSVLVVEYKMTS